MKVKGSNELKQYEFKDDIDNLDITLHDGKKIHIIENRKGVNIDWGEVDA